jgi:hypothetical protein
MVSFPPVIANWLEFEADSPPKDIQFNLYKFILQDITNTFKLKIGLGRLKKDFANLDLLPSGQLRIELLLSSYTNNSEISLWGSYESTSSSYSNQLEFKCQNDKLEFDVLLDPNHRLYYINYQIDSNNYNLELEYEYLLPKSLVKKNRDSLTITPIEMHLDFQFEDNLMMDSIDEDLLFSPVNVPRSDFSCSFESEFLYLQSFGFPALSNI